MFRAYVRQQTPLVTTDLVLAEFGNTIARGNLRLVGIDLIAYLIDAPECHVVYVDPDILRRGVAMYRDRSDKTWGLVDCISFLVMQELVVSDALTADRHFEQAGFRCLLSTPA